MLNISLFLLSPARTLMVIFLFFFQDSSLGNSQNVPRSSWLTLQRAITRSSCHSLRSSSLFTMFQSSKGTQEYSGGRERDIVQQDQATALCCSWALLWVFLNTNGLAKQSLVKAAVSCCLNFVCSFECISFHVVWIVPLNVLELGKLIEFPLGHISSLQLGNKAGFNREYSAA